MSTPYRFPSLVGLEQDTPAASLIFRVELKGALLLARTASSILVFNDILGKGRLVNGGVPGLPRISGEERVVLYYLQRILSRSLKEGRQETCPYGDIIVTEDSERNHLKRDAWQIRYDPDVANNNNVSYTVDSRFWDAFGIEDGNSPPPYWMVSIAIESPDLRWDEGEEWQHMLKRLEEDLQTDRNMFFETSGEYSRCRKQNLSIHFGIEGKDEISIDIPSLGRLFVMFHTLWNSSHIQVIRVNTILGIDIIQQTLTLYGLHENMIDSWMKNVDRPTGVPLARRIRLGMEKFAVDKPPLPPLGLLSKLLPLAKIKRQQAAPHSRGYIMTNELAHFYTHEEFASIIYRNLQWSALKTKISGYPAETQYSDGSMRPYGSLLRDGTTVNVTEPNQARGKLMTVEFKHHSATNDMASTIWWIQFCGHLFRYAAYLGNLRVRTEEPHFINEIVDRNLFELIAFSGAGKTYFENLARITGGSSNAVTAAPPSLHMRKLDLDDLLVRRRGIKRRKYCRAADVEGEMKILEAFLDTYPEDEQNKILLPCDLPFVTEKEWPNFTSYIKYAETRMRQNYVSFPARPDANPEDTDETQVRIERNYLSTTVINAWIDYTGHPRLRRARMERGFVPEMYAHTDEMPVDWSRTWLVNGVRPKRDQRLDDKSLIVGAQTLADIAAQRQRSKNNRINNPGKEIPEDDPVEFLDYESDDSTAAVLVLRPAVESVRAVALKAYDDDNSPYPGETFLEHGERVKMEKRNP